MSNNTPTTPGDFQIWLGYYRRMEAIDRAYPHVRSRIDNVVLPAVHVMTRRERQRQLDDYAAARWLLMCALAQWMTNEGAKGAAYEIHTRTMPPCGCARCRP
jgi:hypothetical protein